MSLQRLFLSLLALAALVLFVSLGRWQLGRAGFKEQRAAATAAAQAAPPQSLDDLLAQPDPALPARVRAEAGRYLAPLVLLDNQVRGRRNGLAVYRAFQPARGPAVLVDLGWVPWSPQRTLPPLPAPHSAARPRGLLVPWPGQALALAPLPEPPADGPWLVPRLERPALADALGAPLFDGVLLLDDAADHGFDRSDPPPAEAMSPDRHRGYAVQWFGLAALVVILYGVLAWKHRHR